jgi:hypothetical protein
MKYVNVVSRKNVRGKIYYLGKDKNGKLHHISKIEYDSWRAPSPQRQYINVVWKQDINGERYYMGEDKNGTFHHISQEEYNSWRTPSPIRRQRKQNLSPPKRTPSPKRSPPKRASPIRNFHPNAGPYEVLGLPRTADGVAIRKEYKKLALRFHPDKNRNVDTTTIFQIISNAYDKIKHVPDSKRVSPPKKRSPPKTQDPWDKQLYDDLVLRRRFV